MRLDNWQHERARRGSRDKMQCHLCVHRMMNERSAVRPAAVTMVLVKTYSAPQVAPFTKAEVTSVEIALPESVGPAGLMAQTEVLIESDPIQSSQSNEKSFFSSGSMV